MSSHSVLAFAVLPTAFALLQPVSRAGDVPVVTVEPACAEWNFPAAPGRQMIPPHITIGYNPRSPGARLTSSQSLTLVLASMRGSRFESMTSPMTLATGGTWQADFTPKQMYIPGYSIFFFEDEQNRIDNNRGQYWDILDCQHGEPSPLAVRAQASTYEGALLAPGIQRPPDLARTVDILKADLKGHSALEGPLFPYGHYSAIWRYELKLGGGSASAYEQVARELDGFIGAHSNEPRALRDISDFIASEQRKLPPSVVQRFREAVTALPQTAELVQHDRTGKIYHVSRNDIPRAERLLTGLKQEVTDMLADLDYWSIDLEEADLQRKAEDYLAFASKYPASSRTGEAYGMAFDCKTRLKDVAGAEAAFEKWTAVGPPDPFQLLMMAEFYIAQKTKLDRVLKLLDTAASIYSESQAPSSHHHFQMQPGRLEFLRGQTHLMLKDLPAARADLEAAAKAAPDKPDILHTLARVCEEMGDSTGALDAYLAAASAPYQDSPAPREAYERLFVAQRLGSRRNADERLLAKVADRSRRAAAEYTPFAMTRPAPEFAFTDLARKRFDNQAAKGKPMILTFWSIWCAPCIAELPAFEELQKQYPGANLLAVKIGNKPEEVKSFLAGHKLKALHVALRADWPQVFGSGALPMTIVMDRFGQIQFVHVGQLADVAAILGKDLRALPEPQ